MAQIIGPISTAQTLPRSKREVSPRMAMLEKLQKVGKKKGCK
jgi:hypothetical protein